jgi:prepilin-type N-terminal cleavage/methylation domain-containing protein
MHSRAYSKSLLSETDASNRPRRRPRRSAFSLIEIIVAMFILAMVATSTIAALVQSQKLAESNLSQAFAEVTAQSIIEQLVAQPFALLTDPGATSIVIKLPGLNASNRTTMDDFQLPWAANDTTFTAVGAPDPNKGVLIDAAYIRESNTIRPERYLPMRMNLRREIAESATERRVVLTLRFQWAVPDRRTGGTPIYLNGELRTVRSSAESF